MLRTLATVTGVALLLGGGIAGATPPGAGQHFDCSDGGTTSCASDDTGCVSNSLNHLKCSSKIAKALAKAVYGSIVCHAKQADMRFKGSSVNGAATSEENCESNPGNSVLSTLDAKLASLAGSGICDPVQLANATAERDILFGASAASLDAQNVLTYCDSSSGALIGDDDAGWVPATAETLKCHVTVGKAIGKLVVAAIKCHDKMNLSFFKGADFDEEACEEINPSAPTKGALAKFNAVKAKLALLAICPACLDSAALDGRAASALAQLNAANVIAYPCGLAP